MAQAESVQAADLASLGPASDLDDSSITNPLNSWYGMLIELLATVAQIVACAVVLAVSTDEKPHKPLRAWVIGYLCACAASLPILYWRYRHLQKLSAAQANRQALLRNQSFGRLNSGSVAAVECFKWMLDCFFLAWFIVGCVWLFSGASSRSVAPHLYWLTFAIIIIYIAAYVLRFLICTAVCCCFACILAVVGMMRDSDESVRGPPGAAQDQNV